MVMATRQSGETRSAVVIMAKAPHPGQVKTRLCPPLTHEEAAALYRCFLLDKIAQVGALQGITPVLSYATADAKPAFESLIPPHFRLIPQLGDDLGARLLSTFDQLFQLGFTQVMAVDSDTPTLPTAYLRHALSLISAPENDVVLGPTEDGGYYLIGLHRPHRELFERMPWSTPQVLPETMHRSQQGGLAVACAPRWYDVDTPDDFARLRQSLGRVRDGLARHTRRFVQELHH
jgi:rSAM/selenodomain-associated transferase 1